MRIKSKSVYLFVLMAVCCFLSIYHLNRNYKESRKEYKVERPHLNHIEYTRTHRIADTQLVSAPFISKYRQAIDNSLSQEELIEDQKERWLDRRKQWIENFPFEPKFHEKHTFDATALKDANARLRQEVKSNANRLVDWAKQYNQGSREPWHPITNSKDTRDLLMMQSEVHGFMKSFYENPLIYTDEFEAIYRIITEYNDNPSPISLGWIYNNLRDYNKITVDKKSDLNALDEEDLRYLNTLKRAITSQLAYNFYEKISPDYNVLELDLATIVMERLLKEVPSEGMLTNKPEESFLYEYYKRGFSSSAKYEGELKDGDPILVP